MFSKIVLAFDGSEPARRAAQIAGDLARQQSQATIWIVVVIDPIPDELGEPGFSQLIETRKAAAQDSVNKAKPLIGDRVGIQQEVLFGSVAESIINVAETRDCDLIVMGSRGLAPLKAWLLGSQAHKVVTLARCPVLVVK